MITENPQNVTVRYSVQHALTTELVGASFNIANNNVQF
jgi:hypothetical protein